MDDGSSIDRATNNLSFSRVDDSSLFILYFQVLVYLGYLSNVPVSECLTKQILQQEKQIVCN